MKIWLHLREQFYHRRSKENPNYIIDINLSLYSEPDIQIVLRMQDLQE